MSSKINKKIPWVEKYRPKSIKDMALPTAKVAGHRVKLNEELKNFINNFFKERERINIENRKIRQFNRTHQEKAQKEEIKIPPEKAAILLEGPPGVGKTSIVYALANDLNMQIIETNASDTRTKAKLEAKLKETVKTKGIMDFILDSKRKLILIDEVDGIYGVSDRGAVPTILNLIESTQFPIILCSNEYQQNLQPIYNKIKRYEINPLPDQEVLRIVKRILKEEKISNMTEEDLNLIIEKNNGDLRGVINDIQALSYGSMDKEYKNLILTLHRDSYEEIFTLIRDLFQKTKTLKEARGLTDKSDVDYNFLYRWVNENLPNFIYLKNEIANAYDNLSMADEIFGRIRKNQYWSLLPYFYDLFAGGVAISKLDKSSSPGFRRVFFPRYSASSFFSLTATEKLFIEKIQEKYSISDIEIIQNILPFLKLLCKTSRKQLKEIADWLELDAKEKKLLK